MPTIIGKNIRCNTTRCNIVSPLDKLNEYQSKSSIKRILLIGKGSSLCAGGDIKSLFLSSGKINSALIHFFMKLFIVGDKTVFFLPTVFVDA